VLNLEIEIMFLCIRTKPDLFNDDLLGFGLNLFLLLFLLVLEFGIINNLAHRRISTWRNLYQVETLFLSEPDSLLDRIYIRLNVLTNNPYTLSSYPLVYFIRFFWSLRPSSERPVETRSAATIIDTR
jgi:hypothetical protein